MKKTFALILACCLLTGCSFNSGELDFGESSDNSYISSENSENSGSSEPVSETVTSSSKSDNSESTSVSSSTSNEPESKPVSSESSPNKPESTPASSESTSSKPQSSSSTPASSSTSSSKPQSSSSAPASSSSSSSKPQSSSSTPASSSTSSSKPQSSSSASASSSSTTSEPTTIEVIGLYGQRAPEAWEVEFANEVFRLTNIERVENGLPEFKRLPLLDNVAYLRAWELIPYYDHTRPDGSRCFTAYEGIDYSYAAENIAAGYRTPEAVVDGWMNSPGHRANILNPNLEYLGVGFYCDSEGIGTTSYKYYWSQNFCSLW